MRGQADHRYNILYTALFAVMVLVPFTARITGLYLPPDISERENRQLAKQPEIDLTLLDPFPKEFEAWYNDHFFLREKLIDGQIWWKLNILKESPFPGKVTIGKEGWLYDAAKERDLYEGKMKIPEEGFRYLVEELHLRTLWYRARGIRFYVLIAPVKQEVYPEYLPAYYRRAPGGTLTDRLVREMRQDTTIRLITPKYALIAEKSSYRLYTILDNHWNYIGGFIAYRELMKEIKKDFPELNALTMKDFRFVENEADGGNLAGMIGLSGNVKEKVWGPWFPILRSFEDTNKRYHVPETFPYPDEYEIRRYIPGSRLPSIMVIRDSYGRYLFPYLSETFSSTFMLFDGWNYHLNPEFVEKEKPDIVVLEIFEAYFPNMLTSLDCLMAETKKQQGN
jgi:alginate O-acetyltransferase complex protein AlgJ